jgi:hypothetical protein
MANIEKIQKNRQENKNNVWLVKLDMDSKKIADEILRTRISRGLCSPSGKEKEGYKDIFKATFRDDDMINKLKTWRFNKNEK